MRISSLLATAACAGVLGACEDNKPQPDEDPDRFRANTHARSSPYAERPANTPQGEYYYQTEEFELTDFTLDNGVKVQIGMLGCVTADRELTRRDFENNVEVRVKMINQENSNGTPLTGTIRASNLYRVKWMKPEDCNGWILQDTEEIPVSVPPLTTHGAAPAPA